jgi:aspartate aminotransferase
VLSQRGNAARGIPDLEGLSIDLVALTAKRDRLLEVLRDAGYEVLPPEGTFYLFGRCPFDEAAFIDALADRDVFVLPGQMMQAPGYFRASLTASPDMIERSLPVFAEVAAERPAQGGKSTPRNWAVRPPTTPRNTSTV